jgi:Lrp/AsnC family transcriptional regulator, regulator for asnA, asnC and gidA
MLPKIELDDLDNKILVILIRDARTPFLEIAKKLDVSSGTIHVRFNKLKEAGVIKGSSIELDFERLNFSLSAFIGINLYNARDHKTVVEKLKTLPEILEIYFTTGKHNLMIKALAKSTREFHLFLIDKIQSIDEIQSTETLIILNEISKPQSTHKFISNLIK